MNTIDITQTHVVHEWKHDRPLIACRISRDGRFVVSSSEDGTLQRWSIPSGERTIITGANSWVHALGFSVDSTQLVSGGCDGRLIWWSANEAEPKAIRTVEAHQGWIRAVDVSADGRWLVSVGNDRQIRLWDMASGIKVAEWLGHERHIYSAVFTPDSQQIISGDLRGRIHLWNVSDKQLVRSFDGEPLYTPNKGQNAEYGGVRSIAYDATRNRLLAGGTYKATNPFGAVHEPLVLRFDWSDGKLLRSHACEGIPGGVVWRTQWLTDGTAIAVSGGSSGGILLFFNDEQDKEIHRFKLPSLARDMDIHAASGLVATAHYDHQLRISGMFAKASS
jgi:WD40 repeat protein